MKIGYLFAGQGQQFVHMGQDLAQEYPDISAIYKTASDILGYDILALTETQLSQTRYTQPALYVLGHALDSLIKAKGFQPHVVAGLSLGEYNALTSSGALDFVEGVALIAKRGEIMQTALPENTTGMAACLKTDIDTVRNGLEGSDIAICNINTPSQIVIGGALDKLEPAMQRLKENGVRMVIPLKVSTVSHMALMEPASQQLRAALSSMVFKTPTIDFINNINAAVQTDGFVDTLSRHIAEPTHMAQTIQSMIDMGIDLFIEVGPKGSISKFVKEIGGKEIAVINVYDIDTLGGLTHE
uniref:ACP S-malonyltransferase n=1 Tax=Erysipelothrix sp. HDW6C TaxID=2714930 RepID=UPI00140D48AE|nr:acyltransferase domain-containing protein [Erysipelothrix sp. HDW6C]QIK69714.1 acyltransferase domain-containing protein [Erysipelothrix sp. HDW6C]